MGVLLILNIRIVLVVVSRSVFCLDLLEVNQNPTVSLIEISCLTTFIFVL